MSVFKNIKAMAIIAAVLLLAAGMAYFAGKKHFDAFPSVLPSYYAKEYCSCRFVAKRSAESCASYSKQFLPLSDFSEDLVNKRIQTQALGRKASAVWVSQRQGCILEP